MLMLRPLPGRMRGELHFAPVLWFEIMYQPSVCCTSLIDDAEGKCIERFGTVSLLSGANLDHLWSVVGLIFHAYFHRPVHMPKVLSLYLSMNK